MVEKSNVSAVVDVPSLAKMGIFVATLLGRLLV
jgi:hypothetical protein